MTDTMRLLSSWQPFEHEVITESVDGIDAEGKPKKKLILKGIMQRADALNQNGRVYPRHILEREVRNYQKWILENRALGECDHPEQSVINLKSVSHIVREAYMDGDAVKGSIEVLDTPCGQIIKSLVESGVKLGISSRGVGSTRKEGDHFVVADDYQLICFDCVSEPSTGGAFMLPEGKVIGKRELEKLFNRTDRVDRILNELLDAK